MTLRGWVGVDLDGTLATYVRGMAPSLGEPIPQMVARIKSWLKHGVEVRIVTARASHPEWGPGQEEELHKWLTTHVGQPLKVQCNKDFDMIELWDDRVVQVETNTGVVIGKSRIGWK